MYRIWVKNLKIDPAVTFLANDGFVIGDPKVFDEYLSVDDLKEMGFIGVYQVKSVE